VVGGCLNLEVADRVLSRRVFEETSVAWF
jgi:hypothetical protein